MADIQNQTTSSKSLVENKNDKLATTLKPNSVGTLQSAQTKLRAQNLSESYQLVKQRQQQYNELSAKNIDTIENCTDDAHGEWQEVCSTKNKLKRKKKLSASLTSVTDTVNQEKRTRIEGMQLNCRGKLQINQGFSAPTTPTHNCTGAMPKTNKLTAKPPLPPAKSTTSVAQTDATITAPPPRLKRKLQENVQTIQKLNALTEQLRLEINELKSSLTTERGAVRVLRAQNEAETRKWRNECKKLQNILEVTKKSSTLVPNISKKPTDATLTNVDLSTNTVNGSLCNYEIQRLTNEIITLKEANKALEEKKMINCDADRRKAADMRTLKDSYEIRLTQLTKSAKTEISRLLEEIKTKERNIGQLKKELQVQQTKPQNDIKSKNATTKTTTNKTKPNKPKKMNLNKNQHSNETNSNKNEEFKDMNQAQNSNEMKQLKNIELINNTKNLQNNINLKTTKLFTNTQNNKHISCENYKMTPNNENNINNILNLTNSTITTNCLPQQKEYHSLPHDISERLLGTTITATTENLITNTQRNDVNEYRTKDNNSDSDSALSSAPPSISPQPPPAGMDATDIWQTIRTYTTDIEKLQKEIEILQKDNEQLQSELNLAKQQILETEKTALEANNSSKVKQLMERVKFLEEQEYQLQAETNELREQNELLEFRILELEETNDKWSLQSHSTTTVDASSTSQTASLPTTKDVWSNDKSHKTDPMQLLFGNHTSGNTDSGITSPNSQHHIEDELNLMDATNEELRQRINNMLRKPALDEEDKQCLQHLLTMVQQLDIFSQRSGPDSLNTTSSSDEPSSLELVKSRISDYSSASSSASTRSANEHNTGNLKSLKSIVQSTNSRIVATVSPYNSSPQHQVPTNTPTDSPRKQRHAWQSNSLSESGVFVESDFLSDASENNACTQTDFEDEAISTATRAFNTELQKLTLDAKSVCKGTTSQLSPNLSEEKRLQYYKERLDLLESKVLIYESSGDIQAKRLADRLQREIQLEKQLKELQDRVDFLESENSTLEEEKCEFEEAENDTRLRLQRLEVELEILSQRNVELEMSREALSAKYKDCRSECLILRDDISVSETQIRHLEEDKQKTKENLKLLHNTLWVSLFYNTIVVGSLRKLRTKNSNLSQTANVEKCEMGNVIPSQPCCCVQPSLQTNAREPTLQQPLAQQMFENELNTTLGVANCTSNDLQILRDEVQCLSHQMKEMEARHYEAMEIADAHWHDLEAGYKERENAYRVTEMCLKQKIHKLQNVLRDDARAADEKILIMEDTEKELKGCLLRLTKEYRELNAEYKNLSTEFEQFKEKHEEQKEQQKPLTDALEQEKKHSKMLSDELNFMRKLQHETESRSLSENDTLRAELYELKKQSLHIEVTNSELREEVDTLEAQIKSMLEKEQENVDKIRVLTDEVRNKEELCQKMEARLERGEGYSLAHELGGSPSKRYKREDVQDLKTASEGLGSVLRQMQKCELPEQNQFKGVAREVKKLADKILYGDAAAEDAQTTQNVSPQIVVTEITQI